MSNTSQVRFFPTKPLSFVTKFIIIAYLRIKNINVRLLQITNGWLRLPGVKKNALSLRKRQSVIALRYHSYCRERPLYWHHRKISLTFNAGQDNGCQSATLTCFAFSWQLLGDIPYSLYILPLTMQQVLCTVRVCKYFSQSTLFGCLLDAYYTLPWEKKSSPFCKFIKFMFATQ